MVLHIGCYVVRDEEGIEEVVTREPTCSGRVRGWSVMVGHVNSDAASIQDGGQSGVSRVWQSSVLLVQVNSTDLAHSIPMLRFP